MEEPAQQIVLPPRSGAVTGCERHAPLSDYTHDPQMHSSSPTIRADCRVGSGGATDRSGTFA
jgi:hypothetical protein